MSTLRYLRKHCIAHCFIAEEGWLKREFKRRVLRLAWRPDFFVTHDRKETLP